MTQRKVIKSNLRSYSDSESNLLSQKDNLYVFIPAAPNFDIRVIPQGPATFSLVGVLENRLIVHKYSLLALRLYF